MLPFLRAKTIIPPICPQLVERPRLLERMRAGATCALTLITAPAGFGKTTLAADWAQRGEMPAAWLPLQPADRPREWFLSYLIQAMQTIAPHLGQTSLALMQGGAPEGVLFALVNDLAEMKSDFALVLDDYHSAKGPETNENIAFLLENSPTYLRIIMTTRNTLAFNLARLRALDQVMEITAADLRIIFCGKRPNLRFCVLKQRNKPRTQYPGPFGRWQNQPGNRRRARVDR